MNSNARDFGSTDEMEFVQDVEMANALSLRLNSGERLMLALEMARNDLANNSIVMSLAKD